MHASEIYSKRLNAKEVIFTKEKGVNLDPKFKSNMLTPKTNSQTCQPKVVLHVMNGRFKIGTSTPNINSQTYLTKSKFHTR